MRKSKTKISERTQRLLTALKIAVAAHEDLASAYLNVGWDTSYFRTLEKAEDLRQEEKWVRENNE